MGERKTILWFDDPDEIRTIPHLYDLLEREFGLAYGDGPSVILNNLQSKKDPFNLLLVELAAGSHTMAALVREQMKRENKFNCAHIENMTEDAFKHGGLNLMEEVRRGSFVDHGFPIDMSIVILTYVADYRTRMIADRYKPVATFEKPSLIEDILKKIRTTLRD